MSTQSFLLIHMSYLEHPRCILGRFFLISFVCDGQSVGFLHRTRSTHPDSTNSYLTTSGMDNSAGNKDLKLLERNVKPVKMGPRSMGTSLQQKRSTKQLISRYESMTIGEAQPPVYSYSRSSSAKSARRIGLSKEASPITVKKDKSPLRQSFSNLFSVFKMGKGFGRDKLDGSLLASSLTRPCKSSLLVPQGDPFALGNSCRELGASEISSKSEKHSNLYSGTLLYLSHPVTDPWASPILPVWTTCTTTLRNAEIILTWLTTHGNPSTHVISLTAFADIRSLSLNQIDPNERALLPTKGGAEELRIFEILFEGRPREKFAATSVKERAGWVSAVWDAILPSQDQQVSAYNDRPHASPPTNASLVVHGSIVESEHLGSVVRKASGISATILSTSCHSERSLPPIPVSSSPPLPSPPVYDTLSSDISSSTIRTQTSRTSFADVRSKSPSVINLGQLSVVKQRLAQMEYHNSTPKITSPCSTRSSGKTRGGSMMQIVKHPRPEVLKTDILRHHDSLRSNSGDSILDSYGDTSFTTPVDPVHLTRSDSSKCELQEVDRTAPPQESWETCSVTSPASRYSVAVDIECEPLAEFLQDHLAKNHTQTIGLRGQLCSLEGQLEDISLKIKSVVNSTPLVESINHVVKDIRQRTNSHGDQITDVCDKLDKIGEEVRGQISSASPPLDIAGLKKVLEDMQHQLGSDMPRIAQKLEEIQSAQGLQYINPSSPRNNAPTTIMRNLKPSCLTLDDLSQCGGPHGDEVASTTTDLAKVETKLDELLSLYRTFSGITNSGNRLALDEEQAADFISFKQSTQELKVILDSLDAAESHRILQEQQQADSVRYLNELNSWLEKFVNNNTSQIHAAATGVQKLCQELGCKTDFSDLPGSSLGSGETNTILADIRQLIVESKTRETDSVTLKASVDTLVAVINQNADVRNGFTPESVMALIHRQRQDQEGLLRALTAELSSEIRGERLRFVEAMKEATAINVQIHVEQFKKELNREVMVMTQEIERMHRKKQAVENQIADLFAFYSKHKQAQSQVTTHSEQLQAKSIRSRRQ